MYGVLAFRDLLQHSCEMFQIKYALNDLLSGEIIEYSDVFCVSSFIGLAEENKYTAYYLNFLNSEFKKTERFKHIISDLRRLYQTKSVLPFPFCLYHQWEVEVTSEDKVICYIVIIEEECKVRLGFESVGDICNLKIDVMSGKPNASWEDTEKAIGVFRKKYPHL